MKTGCGYNTYTPPPIAASDAPRRAQRKRPEGRCYGGGWGARRRGGLRGRLLPL